MVDVAGAGGTTWPGVESLRGSPRQRELGGVLREWGVPTAASLVYARRLGVSSIASGGIRSAHDIVSALVLGATAAGLALPFFRAFEARGEVGLRDFGRSLAEGVRTLMLLVGARNLAELRRVPAVFGRDLEAWTRRDLLRPVERPAMTLRSDSPRPREVAL
jgi:isopentenyl-diphosphate delta-isomerase